MFNPKPIVFVLCFVLLACVGRGQYYPGGLGNANLVIWLNANKTSSITKNGANQVSQWSDLSGNGYNFGQATLAKEPIYGAATGPYNRPALTFTSTSTQYLGLPTLPASVSFTGGISAFAMGSFNAPQTAQGWQRIYDFGNGQASNNITFGRRGSTANLYYEGWNGGAGDQTYTTINSIVNGFDTLYEAIQLGGAVATLSAVSHYLSGTTQADNGQAGSSKTWVPAALARTSNYIGRSNWAPDNYFSGTLSEILFYNTGFNTTKRVIMENYLSAEWGEAISTSKYTPPSSTTYTTNLVGIGYTSAADNFLANPAGSTDGLGFSSGATAADFLGSAGYLMGAHNGQANTLVTNAVVSGIGASVDYWNRSWYLNATGGNSGGTVSLNFNFSDYNGSALPGAVNYFLVYNAGDGSFASGTNQLIAVNSSTAGATVSFTVKGSSLANGYYAIMWWPSVPAISVSASPVCEGGAVSFSASAVNGCVYQWQVNTGSGFGNVPATDPGGAVYSGATSTSLGITGITASLNSYTYQLLLTGPNGPAIVLGPVSPVVNAAPAAQAMAAAANPICAGSGTTVSIVSPVAGVTYNIYSDPALTVNVGSLTTAANSLAVGPATTTTYYEQAVETATGCVQTAAVQSVVLTVNPAPAAQVVAAAADPICAGSGTMLSIVGPVAGVIYNIYSDPALTVNVGSLTTVANSLAVSPATTTTYYEQAVETATGCVQTAAVQSLMLTVNPAPAAQVVAAAANPICAGSGTTLSIVGPVAGVIYNIYSDPALTVNVGSLTTAANSVAVGPLTTTTYYEQAVETATGCVQTAPVQNLTLTVNPAPAAQALAAAANPICAGSGTTLSIVGPVAGVTYNIYSDPALTISVGSLTSVANSLAVSPATTTTYYEQAVTTATGCVQTAPVQNVTLTVNPAPAVQSLAAAANPICAGSGTTLSIVSPVAGVTYNIYSDPALTVNVGSLTTAANSLAVIPAATTTYYEQAVTTATGCVQTAPVQNVTLTVNPAPAAQSLAAAANPICAGSGTTLSIVAPVAGVTYNIYSDPALTVNVGSLTIAANSLVIGPLTTTTYYEQAVETATGCVQTAAVQSVTLTVNPAPAAQAVAAAANPICAGSGTTLSIVSPVAGVTYNIYSDPALTVNVGSLTTAANSLMVGPLTTTTYYEQAVETATGCVQTAAVQNLTLTVNPAPAAQSLAAAANPICAGSGTTLSIVSPVAGVTYNIYSDPALTVNVGSLTTVVNSLAVSPATTTTYYEQAVETATGCVQTAPVQNLALTVNPAPAAQVVAAAANPICAGSGTTLSIVSPVAGVTYNIYSDPALTVNVGSLTTAANSLAVIPAATTTYYEQAVTTATGCVQTAPVQNVTLTVNPAPAAQSLAAAANPICAGSGTTLSIVSPVAGVTYNIYSDPGLTVNVGSLTTAANSLVAGPLITTTYYEQAVETATGCVQTAPVQSVVLTVNPAPAAQAVAAAANPICAGSGTTLSIVGPVAGVTYNIYSDPALTVNVGSLTTAANSLAVGPATTTTYYEQAVETATGCVQAAAVQSLTLTVNAAPAAQAVAAAANPICAGSGTTLSIVSPVAGVTYNIYSDPALTVNVGSLTTAANSLVAGPLITTTYYEQAVETATGCVQTAAVQSVTLTVNPAPAAQAMAAAANPICAGSGTTLSIVSPLAGVTYNIYSDPALTVNVGSLTTAANSLAASPATTTTYYEQAVETATGCVQTAAAQSVTLTVNPAPAAQAVAAAANPICAGGGTTLSIVGPVVGVTYNIYSDPALTVNVGSLTTAANSVAVGPLTTTTYYEQAVETATGCVQTAAVQSLTLTVNPAPAAQAMAAAANPICAGSGTMLSIVGPVAGVTYNIYSDPALTVSVGSLTTAANSLAVGPATTTTYYEQAVETATGCVQTAAVQSVTLTVNPAPAAQAMAAAANPICAGSGTTLSIVSPVAGVTYNIYSDPALTVSVGSLTTAANSLVVGPATTTTYYEQAVETATGCVQTAAVESVTLTVNADPQLTTTGNLTLCDGSPDTLSAAAPGATITWLGYGTQNSIVVSPTTATTYTVTAQTAANCTATATLTVQVVNFKISLAASPDPVIAGFPVNLVTNSNQSYQVLSWLPESRFPDQTAMSQTFTIIDTSKTYTVIAQSANGCIDTASVTVTVETNTGDLFIPNAFTPNGDGKNDIFKVYGSSINQMELRIFNQWGQLLFESKDPQRGWDGTYGGHLQPTGVYLYAVKLTLYGQTSPIIRKGSLNLIR